MIDDPLNRLKVLRGSQLPQAKLTESDVKEIHRMVQVREDYRMRARDLSNAKIAEKFGVHKRTVEKVIQGYSWSHVEGWEG